MTTRTQTSSNPFTRLSLKGAQSPPPNARNQRPARDDDYIPYTGPYEEPPRARKARNRDSWGDPIYDEDGNDMIQELHQRYVPPDQYPWQAEDEERKSRPRARTHSGVSGHTGSSGAIDPHRGSVGVSSVLRRPSHHANVARPPVPSYINLDAAGGVGESPAPPPREVAAPKRGSLASIFAFGQKKALPLSPAKIPLPTSPPATSPPPTAQYARAFPTQPLRLAPGPPSIYSVSSDRHQTDTYTSQEGDVYHSYYNYTPAADQFGHLANPRNATPPNMHPYAYNRPPQPEPPQTAPIPSSKQLKFTTTQPPHRHALPLPQQQMQQLQEAPVSAPRLFRTLKNYASTPNLRDSSRSPNRLKKPFSPGLKGKDRWLSPETWCDAVMLPRPRLKIEDAQQLLRGRIVSPPGSPIFGGSHAQPNLDRPEGMASRVLAHSRSMASLQSNAEAGPSRLRNDEVTFKGMPTTTAHEPPKLVLPTQMERPPRPKSFAWDDLALPSPVPSLARVLEEGQILEHQRKKWQMQATGSFQNTRTRSLSRTRTKSLGKGGRGGTVEYLAARSIVGNQDVVPLVPRRQHARSGSQSGTNTNGTTTFTTRTSHSHSNSLVKTTSKSSLSQGHSRNDSWTRTAIKKAAALCYDDNISPADEKAGEIETAIRGVGTKVIRLADPAQLLVDARNGVSPTPSGTSDAHMGIAISTPPPNGSQSEHESIHLPSHPYAQGGVTYPSHNVVSASKGLSKGADYAGPHLAVPVIISEHNDFSTRHRLPPQAQPQTSLTYHPYAAPSSRRESYQIVPRSDSDVPPNSKMWAQLSPGVVREILPSELLYSPFMSERSETPEVEHVEREEYDAYARHRKSTATILDTVGLGETLAYAVEEENNRDSGLGTSEDHPVLRDEEPGEEEWADDGQAAAVQAHHPYRIHRKPVQYDVSLSRPPYSTPKKSEISGASTSHTKDTNHTAASSPVDPTVSHEHRLTPPTPPLPSHGHHPSESSSPIQHSEASSPPRSPPPLGSVDDLDEFRDLFYKPNLTDEVLNNLSRPGSGRMPSVTWDMASTTRTQRTRTGSGLTSLARQLSQEFEELRAIRQQQGRSESMDSESSISRFSRFPTENDIHFVFADSRSEMLRSIGEQPAHSDPPSEAMSAFHPSSHLPEDVVSSRASSPGIEGSLDHDEEHEPFRVGSVEAVSTPPAVSAAHRSSFTGQLSFAGDTHEPPPVPKHGIHIPRAVSSLQPPHSADPTRSSYMTESTVSRMSNLSDFPVPPSQPAHMSVLSSYFHGRELVTAPQAQGETQSVSTFKPRIGERF
ncbi:hypothetical protein K438DRAFT_1934158 [Mycena galopus ATCC 62051]|nr:hypothetical protein K438DRAFT_1934158 [Mycena galopus ATCC 62051]